MLPLNINDNKLQWCPDCDGSYCTNCKPKGGVNVCMYCGSYSGRSTPSFTNDIRDPDRSELSKIQLNLPQWAKDL